MFALDQASSASAAFTTGSSSYDVFLNFRGEDTRNNFTGLLHLFLKDKGIDVFIDSKDLWIGEAIGPALCRAIEGSKISIPVFSEGYAHSKWCLLELSQILQCHKSNGQMVLPIFFNVEPSHVRNQTGSFKKAFQEHEKNYEPHVVECWREALKVIGNLTGEVIDQNKNQAEVVALAVKRVMDELISRTHLAECKYPIGIEPHVKDISSLLNTGSNDVQFIGICGIGGIGKTTIAKAVYNNNILNFKRHSFISDVREQAMQFMGLVSLQKRLLKDIFGIDIDISHYHKGKKLIEQRLCKENVLLVLDDVDSKEEMDALAGELNWFGQGSRVIITTRVEHILNVAGVDKIYWPQLLNLKESLRLFSLHAFSMEHPPQDYMRLSHDVVCYSEGLPSTIEVLGSYLSYKNNKEVWKNTLQNLKAGITSISSLASLRMKRENTCPMEDNPSSSQPMLYGNTAQIENAVMPNGNCTTVVSESKSTGGYLNPNGFTATIKVGKQFTIKAKITNALSKFCSGYPNLNDSTTTVRDAQQFRIEDMKTATNNFDESLVIGVGGFGKVYKGVIDGTLAAIKCNDPLSRQGLKEFETEIEMLSKLRHRHLVSMIGFCKEMNETILVIEYMANGTLRNHLLGTDLPPLTWEQRLEICIGAARGLHYLHTWAEIGIIHRDVKTSNILLDENFVAKMADFGLSKIAPTLDDTYISANVMGTYGYLDPEYIQTRQLTIKSDVYSFGVVLLEVVCARSPVISRSEKHEFLLTDWALRKQRQGSLETIVDRRLKRSYCPESLKKFVEIAEKCVAPEGKNRPTIEEVLWDLEYVLLLHEAWLRSNAGKESITLGETQESQNSDSQDDESSIELGPMDDEEPFRTWTTSFGGTVGFDEFSDLVDPQCR